MSRFLAGSTNSYREYDEETFDGLNELTGEDYTDRDVDCKIVTRIENKFHHNKAPIENSEQIQVRLTFKPFLGSPTRLPDEIEYDGVWYVFFAVKDPGKIMPHYIAYAYKETGVPNE